MHTFLFVPNGSMMKCVNSLPMPSFLKLFLFYNVAWQTNMITISSNCFSYQFVNAMESFWWWCPWPPSCLCKMAIIVPVMSDSFTAGHLSSPSFIKMYRFLQFSSFCCFLVRNSCGNFTHFSYYDFSLYIRFSSPLLLMVYRYII